MTTLAHQGQVLGKLATIAVLQSDLARQFHVPANRITQAIQGKRGVTDASALRLSHWFDDAAELMMGPQVQRDISEATREVGMERRSPPRHPTQAGMR